MFFKKCFDKVLESDSFKELQESSPNYFLVGFFCMADSKDEFEDLANWSVDFFDMDKNTIASFKGSGFEESKLLDKDAKIVPFELEVHDLLPPPEVLEKSMVKNFTKVIALLRQKDSNPVFSLKFLLVPLKLKQIELDAVSGKVLSEEDSSLLDLAKKD